MEPFIIEEVSKILQKARKGIDLYCETSFRFFREDTVFSGVTLSVFIKQNDGGEDAGELTYTLKMNDTSTLVSQSYIEEAVRELCAEADKTLLQFYRGDIRVGFLSSEQIKTLLAQVG